MINHLFGSFYCTHKIIKTRKGGGGVNLLTTLLSCYFLIKSVRKEINFCQEMTQWT